MNDRPLYKTLVFDSSRWDGFEFRSDDIVVSTPAKCGTTWTQTILAMMVLGTPTLPEPISLISPWLDMLTRRRDDVVADLEAQTHRRIIKSHTPYPGLPIDPRVTYITVGRDPRDAYLSWDNHLANSNTEALFAARAEAVGLDDIAELLAAGPPPSPPELIDRFWAWVDDPGPVHETVGLSLLLHHLETFWNVRDEPNVIILHYDEMLDDLDGQMRGLAARLGIDVPEEMWPQLVAAARFDSMKERADATAPEVEKNLWLDNSRFFNRGTSGQWREVLNDDDVERYRKRVAELASPGLARWVHRDESFG